MDSSSIRTAIVLGSAFFAGRSSALAQTTLVSVDSSGAHADGESRFPRMTPDERFVAFSSDASNLVASDTNGCGDAFVHDRSTGRTERVSVDSSGREANGGSVSLSISADGRFVAFVSDASNLVAGDTNGAQDIFVRDRSTGDTERVSVDSAGAEANGGSYDATVSADGGIVAFYSSASNLVPGDANGVADIFIKDRTTNLTERVSVDSAGAEANGGSSTPSISADGESVAFESEASNLVIGDTNGLYDVFVHDRSTGFTELVSVDSSGIQGNMESESPSLSQDARLVVFESWATNLVADDTNSNCDVFVHDRVSGLTERVNVSSDGAETIGDWGFGSWGSSISAEGEFVAFSSTASNLVPGDTNGQRDIFVHDRSTGLTKRVSVDSAGRQAYGDCLFTSIAAAGRTVAFDSSASNLVVDDTNGALDVFVHEDGGAIWSNYGSGFSGTNGVPSFTSRSDPAIGTTVTLDLANSWDEYTVGALFLGFERTTLPSTWGGDLLVVPFITQLVGLSPWGTSLFGDLPDDESLCGCLVELQVIEADPGAAKGVSFTPGLELVIGH